MNKIKKCFLDWIKIKSKIKEGKYYYHFKRNGRGYSIILSQLRLLSGRRLLRKQGLISQKDFKIIKEAVHNLLK